MGIDSPSVKKLLKPKEDVRLSHQVASSSPLREAWIKGLKNIVPY